jgi:hypothetical protein
MSNRLVKNDMLVGISVRQPLYAWLFFSSSVVCSTLCFYYHWFCMSIFAKYLFTLTRLELICMFIKYSYNRHMIIHLIVSNWISCLLDTLSNFHVRRLALWMWFVMCSQANACLGVLSASAQVLCLPKRYVAGRCRIPPDAMLEKCGELSRWWNLS